MNHQDTTTPTLFNLLARKWSTDAGITAMLFNAEQTAVAFALEDGVMAIARVGDEDAPEDRIHISAENGRSTIQPRSKAPDPLNMIEVTAGEPMLLGTIGEANFVAAGIGGPLYQVSPDGDKQPIGLELDAGVTAFDHCQADGQFACVSGTRILVFDPGTTGVARQFDHGDPITALAFAPDGQSIAVAHDYGLTIWLLGAGEQATKDIAFAGRPGAVHWRPDGRWIACPLGDGGFQLSCIGDGRTSALTDYPAPVGSIAWNKPANALITSGAFRITAWSMDTPPVDDTSSGALETGRAGLVPVSAVCTHPARNLVAAGYDNGFLSIVQIAGRDELVLNSEDHGAVSNLEWSRNGRSIAVATDRQQAAIVSLPPQMFK